MKSDVLKNGQKNEQDKSEILLHRFVQSRSQFKTNGIPVFFSETSVILGLFLL